MKEKKVKRWFDEHKKEIKSGMMKVGIYAIGFGIGYFTADKITTFRIGAGLSTLRTSGIIKFFDPSNGLEIDVNKAVDLVKQIGK